VAREEPPRAAPSAFCPHGAVCRPRCCRAGVGAVDAAMSSLQKFDLAYILWVSRYIGWTCRESALRGVAAGSSWEAPGLALEPSRPIAPLSLPSPDNLGYSDRPRCVPDHSYFVRCPRLPYSSRPPCSSPGPRARLGRTRRRLCSARLGPAQERR